MNFRIREDRLEKLSQDLEKLQKRMSRLDDDCKVTLEVLDIQTENNDGLITMFYLVEISGELPDTGDYRFVGRLYPDMETGQNLVMGLGDEDLPIRFRNSGKACEHCNLRRDRKTIYVLQNTTDQSYLQVGSTCVNDFTGTITAEKIAAAAEIILKAKKLAEASEDLSDSDYRPRWLDLRTFLGHTNQVIEEMGWVGRGTARDTDKVATADIAYNRICVQDPVDDKHLVAADAALEWLDTNWKPLPSPNDYQHNLLVSCEDDLINGKMIGIVASLMIVWRRATTKKSFTSNWLGVEGDRITFAGKIIFTKFLSTSQYGDTYITKVRDAQGIVTYFGRFVGDVGDEVSATATIKKLDEFKGEKQTVINRPRWA